MFSSKTEWISVLDFFAKMRIRRFRCKGPGGGRTGVKYKKKGRNKKRGVHNIYILYEKVND